MTDYGRVVQFGVFPEPVAARLDEILALVGIADRNGLDLVGIQDHPYQRRYLDTWMLVATVLARTERITVFSDVANLPLRPPAVMAKAAASLDVRGFQPSSQRVAVTGADRSGGQRMMVAVSSASSAPVWRAQARPAAVRARALP